MGQHDRVRMGSRKSREQFSEARRSFVEAASVFFDTLSVTIPDPLHSAEEDRFVITALSNRQRHLVVVHSDRGVRIRIISARLASPSERKRYESAIE